MTVTIVDPKSAAEAVIEAFCGRGEISADFIEVWVEEQTASLAEHPTTRRGWGRAAVQLLVDQGRLLTMNERASLRRRGRKPERWFIWNGPPEGLL